MCDLFLLMAHFFTCNNIRRIFCSQPIEYRLFCSIESKELLTLNAVGYCCPLRWLANGTLDDRLDEAHALSGMIVSKPSVDDAVISVVHCNVPGCLQRFCASRKILARWFYRAVAFESHTGSELEPVRRCPCQIWPQSFHPCEYKSMPMPTPMHAYWRNWPRTLKSPSARPNHGKSLSTRRTIEDSTRLQHDAKWCRKCAKMWVV